ncbi:tetraketide alpha-pyrone reductase 2 isoform X2 [Diospyros lotus]|uniref:tetraketide alpha-pyrone reductase 2 isoform X2 n=1 Tax=Diospyros lotus TaxID=55363 RepID=UPI00225724A3|nr:tetraketide alpha-pyrone reductase 2 isoform X2 [Diospyros lotus]
MPEYCVTGGTGLIGASIVKSLLEKGHIVRTTVRDPENVEKVGFLWQLQGAKERLKIFQADVKVEGSFDESIQGVDGVFHAAAPVLVPHDENIQLTLVDPAIKGTLNVLSSCKKSSSVRRVVLTSSCSAIRYRADAQQVSPLNESHWSDLEYCKQYNLWYAYAKTLAEKEAWRAASEIGIDLVVVNPSYVVGPLITPQPTSSRGEYPNQALGFVHTDDMVAAHILAMEKREASGRIICSSSVAHWSEIMEMLRAKYPSYPFESKCGNQKGDDTPHAMNCSKILELGLPPPKTLDQMFDDCIKSFQAKGFL